MTINRFPGGATIRRADEFDLPEIISLLESETLGSKTPGMERAGGDLAFEELSYRRAFVEISQDPSTELWVVVRQPGGEVVGTMQIIYFTTLSWGAARRAQLAGVRVATDQRGAGLGTEMIGWALEHARSKGCDIVQLSSDKRRVDAHRFYERLGFTASHEGLRKVLG